MRLFCLPYAGGSAVIFRDWASRLGAQFDVFSVEYPGRGMRYQDSLATNINELAKDLAADICEHIEQPFAYFGHSMGALIGFLILRRLEDGGHPRPNVFFASGCKAPHLPGKKAPIHHLPNSEFLQKLASLNGTPPEFLAHPELMKILMPILRNDFRICETYRHERSVLSCPIWTFGGLADHEIPEEEIVAWSSQTTGDTRHSMFPGDHFFLKESESLVLHTISTSGAPETTQ